MNNFFRNIFVQISNFGIFEWGIIKAYLIIVGILLGTYFSDFFEDNIRIVWCIVLVLFVFSIYFFFIKKYDKNESQKNNESIERK